MSKHTATPWTVVERGHIRAPDLTLVAVVQHGRQTEANAAHIVRCVNNFDALVEALERALPSLRAYNAYGWPDRAGVIKAVDAAIAAARSGP